MSALVTPPATASAAMPPEVAQLPVLPGRFQGQWVAQVLRELPDCTEEDWSTGWAAALVTVCTRPSLIAVVGDAVGVTLPAGGVGGRPFSQVVSEYAQKYVTVVLHMAAVEMGAVPADQAVPLQYVNCVAAGTPPGGVWGLWQTSASRTLTPLQRVQEWPDLVVRVGVGEPLPIRFPVPLLTAPVDWLDPDAAAAQLAEECAAYVQMETSLRLVVETACTHGWHAGELEQMMRRMYG